MKTIYQKKDREDLIDRIKSLNKECQPLWGKMNAYQMIRHCMLWDEMLQGKKKYKQSFIGKLFGKFGLKDMLKDSPIKANLPTVPSFKIADTGDADIAKTEWIKLLEQHDLIRKDSFVHPFFGKLSSEQGGIIAFKHIHHHLKQFGL